MAKRPRKPKHKTSLKTFVAVLGASLIVLTIAMVCLFRVIAPPVTGVMVSRYISRRHSGPENRTDIARQWVPLSHVSCHIVRAVIAAEDQRFEHHHGFDTDAILAALKNNLSGGKLRGGSTITQQTAKNLFLWPGRSWLRKGLETYFTFFIEALWTKRRIIEIYLNIVEFGDHLYGVEAASRQFFNKKAREVTPSEAAMLAALLPQPLARNPARPSAALKRKQGGILAQMERMPPTHLCAVRH